jgi:hypothetical protein
MFAVLAARRLRQYEFVWSSLARHFGQQPVKGNFGIIWMAVFAGFDHSLGRVKTDGAHEDYSNVFG